MKTKIMDLTLKHADTFIRDLAKRLGLKGSHICAGYEDPLYYLLAEGLVPNNLNPLKSDLKDDLERKRLTKVLTGDLGCACGLFAATALESSA